MTDNQRTPWLRIGAESLAIIGSILLAFMIDALWDNYQDRREEYEILLGLDDEFTRNLDSIEVSMQQVNRVVDSIDFLLNPGGIDLDRPDAIEMIEQAVLYSSFTTPPDELSGGIRDALLETGKLDLIRNVELRQALVQWPISVNQLEQQRTAVTGFVMQSLLPHLSSLGVPLGEIRLPTGRRLVDQQLSSEGLSARYAGLLADQQYLNLVTVRNWWALGTLQDYQDAAKRAREIVNLLKKEIEVAD